MKRNRILSFKSFEHATHEKMKPRWTQNDAIITLYYEKFGLERIGISESRLETFVNQYIGSTKNSLKMQAGCIRYLLSRNGVDESGFSHYSQYQKEAVEKYKDLDEKTLRKMVEDILDGITPEEQERNLQAAEEEKREEERERRRKEKEKFKLTNPVNVFGVPKKPLVDISTHTEIPYEIGDTVEHTKFGKGVLTDIKDNIMHVDFDTLGPKRVLYNPNLFV